MTTTTTEQTIEFVPQIMFPAFSSEGKRGHNVQVEVYTGTIRVWDSTAGHYTLRHSIPEWHAARIRAEAIRRFL